ncbi:MAG: hypothetical protein ACRYHQ_20290 [Janthinobacterium lividum]
MVDAILDERVLATSGWNGDQLRIGSFQEAEAGTGPRPISNLQRQCWSSWKGTFDRDEVLS